MAHDGHPGIVRMKQRCREAVWWPKMNIHVEQLVLECEACARSGKSVNPVQPPLQPIPWPARPWKHLEIDIAGEFVAAPQSHKYMIVVHDLHSKWSEVSCTSSVTSGTVVKTLQELFTRWGLPEAVTTDNGPQFTSFEFTEFLRCQGIEHRVTSLYNPQSNGGVERFNRTMKEGIKASMAEGKSFAEAVRTTLCNYRATKHALTGTSPAELMIGRKLILPLDNLKPPQTPQHAAIFSQAEHVATKQKALKSYVDTKRKAKIPKFDVGHWVRVRKPVRGHKLKPVLTEPLKIVERIGPSTFQLRDGTKWSARRLVRVFKAPAPSSDASSFIDDASINVGPDENLNQPLMNYDSTHPLPDVELNNSCAAVTRPHRNRCLPARLKDYELYF